jgi:hypothetical protein
MKKALVLLFFIVGCTPGTPTKFSFGQTVKVGGCFGVVVSPRTWLLPSGYGYSVALRCPAIGAVMEQVIVRENEMEAL